MAVKFSEFTIETIPGNVSYIVGYSGSSNIRISSANLLSGVIPYVGAIDDVDLGTFGITANKFIKLGGTSSQFLKADGSIDSNTYLTAASGYVPYTGALDNLDLGIYNLTALSIIKAGGTSSEFLKADGSTSILPSFSDYVPYIGAINNLNLGTYSVTANSIIKAGGTGLQYLMADGTVSTGPSLTGYVPYTGATSNLNLGLYSITANTLVKAGGLSSQFLKADGSVDSSIYITDADVLNTPLTGFVATQGVVSDADTILSGMEKIAANALDVSSTGVYSFAGLTLASSTTFNVGAAKGFIVDNTTNLANPTVIEVNYAGQTGLSDPNINTSTETYVLLNSLGVLLLQPTFPTPQQRRQNIFLGKLGHPDKLVFLNAFSQPDVFLSPLSQLRDVWTPINLINGGVYPSPNGANLQFNTSAGTLYGLGINFINNPLAPSTFNVSAQSPTTFRYRTQTGGTSGNITTIDPTNYDLNGVITAISGAGGNCTNQRIYALQNGQIRVQYGQQVYNSISSAIAGIQTESFVTFPNFIDNAILIGVLSVTKNCTDLTDTSRARILLVSKFGESVGSAGGVSTTTLQQAYNNSIQPEIITNSTLGAVSIQRGSAADTDNVLEIQNGAGTDTAFITGLGNVTANSFVKTLGTSSQFLKADGSVDANSYITLSGLSATTPLNYSNITGTFSIQQAGVLLSGYLSSSDWNTFYNKQNAITLTTTGNSGAATLIGGTLNIPQYITTGAQTFTGTKTFDNGISIPSDMNASFGFSSAIYEDGVDGYFNIVTAGPSGLSLRSTDASIEIISYNNLFLNADSTGNNIGDIIFNTAGTPKAILTNSGKFGIGNSATGSEILQVTGNTLLIGNLLISKSGQTANTSIDGLKLENNTPAVISSNTSSVGQQFSPSTKLKGNYWNSTSGTSKSIEFKTEVVTIQNTSVNSNYLGIFTSDDGAAYSTTPRFAFTAQGNFGIGGIPTAALHVFGSATIQFNLGANLLQGNSLYVPTLTTNYITKITTGGQFIISAIYDNAGKIGIGNTAISTDNEKLQVTGDTLLTGNLKVTGSAKFAFATKISTSILTLNEQSIEVTAVSTITLPLPSSSNIGKEFVIKNNISVGGIVTVSASTSTIDGSATYSLSARYKYVRVISNGTVWLIIANN
jgi:hypothetical protein